MVPPVLDNVSLSQAEAGSHKTIFSGAPPCRKPIAVDTLGLAKTLCEQLSDPPAKPATSPT